MGASNPGTLVCLAAGLAGSSEDMQTSANPSESLRNPPEAEYFMHSQDRCRLPSEGIALMQMPLAS